MYDTMTTTAAANLRTVALEDLCKAHLDRTSEPREAIPAGAVLLWVEALDALDLAKGLSHKYIKRVPYVRADGRRSYRYWYALPGRDHIAHSEHLVEGAAFKVEGGHFHVTKVEGDLVHVRHDESGEEKKLTRAELAKMLQEHHKEAITKRYRRLKADHAQAHKTGTAQQRVAAKAALDRHVELYGHPEGEGPEAEEKKPAAAKEAKDTDAPESAGAAMLRRLAGGPSADEAAARAQFRASQTPADKKAAELSRLREQLRQVRAANPNNRDAGLDLTRKIRALEGDNTDPNKGPVTVAPQREGVEHRVPPPAASATSAPATEGSPAARLREAAKRAPAPKVEAPVTGKVASEGAPPPPSSSPIDPATAKRSALAMERRGVLAEGKGRSLAAALDAGVRSGNPTHWDEARAIVAGIKSETQRKTAEEMIGRLEKQTIQGYEAAKAKAKAKATAAAAPPPAPAPSQSTPAAKLREAAAEKPSGEAKGETAGAPAEKPTSAPSPAKPKPQPAPKPVKPHPAPTSSGHPDPYDLKNYPTAKAAREGARRATMEAQNLSADANRWSGPNKLPAAAREAKRKAARVHADAANRLSAHAEALTKETLARDLPIKRMSEYTSPEAARAAAPAHEEHGQALAEHAETMPRFKAATITHGGSVANPERADIEKRAKAHRAHAANLRDHADMLDRNAKRIAEGRPSTTDEMKAAAARKYGSPAERLRAAAKPAAPLLGEEGAAAAEGGARPAHHKLAADMEAVAAANMQAGNAAMRDPKTRTKGRALLENAEETLAHARELRGKAAHEVSPRDLDAARQAHKTAASVAVRQEYMDKLAPHAEAAIKALQAKGDKDSLAWAASAHEALSTHRNRGVASVEQIKNLRNVVAANMPARRTHEDDPNTYIDVEHGAGRNPKVRIFGGNFEDAGKLAGKLDKVIESGKPQMGKSLEKVQRERELIGQAIEAHKALDLPSGLPKEDTGSYFPEASKHTALASAVADKAAKKIETAIAETEAQPETPERNRLIEGLRARASSMRAHEQQQRERRDTIDRGEAHPDDAKHWGEFARIFSGEAERYAQQWIDRERERALVQKGIGRRRTYAIDDMAPALEAWLAQGPAFAPSLDVLRKSLPPSARLRAAAAL